MNKHRQGNPPAAQMDGTQKRQAIFAEFMKRSTVPSFEHESSPAAERPIEATHESKHGRRHVDT